MPAIAALAYAAYTGIAITGSMVLAAAIETIAIIGSYLAYQNAKRGRFDQPGAGALVNTRSAEEPLPVLYGRHRIGGNQVHVHATGENNKYIHIIQTISEGPIEGIEQVYLDDKPASEYGDLVHYEFFNGAGDQGICTTLQGANPDWNRHMRWTAYLYIRLEYNAEKFTGLPKITVVAKGRKLKGSLLNSRIVPAQSGIEGESPGEGGLSQYPFEAASANPALMRSMVSRSGRNGSSAGGDGMSIWYAPAKGVSVNLRLCAFIIRGSRFTTSWML